MDEPESVIQSEVRRRKTSYINMHMWNIKKSDMDESFCRNREADIEKRLMGLGLERVG